MKPAYELLGQPQGLIVDGAGTLFDPGSVVPAHAFVAAFKEKRINVDFDTVMKYMGREKKSHITLLLKEDNVLQQFKNINEDRNPDATDIDALYDEFKNQLYPSAVKTEEIPGVKDAAFELKQNGPPLIMTTGYPRPMVDKTIEKLPWIKEVLTASYTSDDVPRGRPFPYMLHRAMERLEIANVGYLVKVGDTKVDMEAPDNICMPGIIVTSGSITTTEKAEEINEQLERKHFIAPDLARIIELALEKTLPASIKNLNIE